MSIFHIKKGDLYANVVFETLSDSGKHEVIAQKYISDAKTGDKRILLLDGEPIGALLRVRYVTMSLAVDMPTPNRLASDQ